MAAAARQQHGASVPRARYVPPRRIVEIDTSDLGFKNGFFLKVPVLYASGDLNLFTLPGVAIVGSRKTSVEGKRRAEQLARDLAKAGIVVISGMAAGIDAAAHRAAIDAGGRTIAVIGTPLERAYPAENAELQQEVYERHLLLSPFPAGTRTFPSHFPERNRVMARLAVATVIVEASDTSGSLHQASESVALGKPVFIAESVVNDPTLTWPARFIGKPHAYVLRSSADLIALIPSAE